MKHFCAQSYLVRFFLIIIVGTTPLSIFAQKKNEAYQLHIRKTESTIKVDGIIDEETWKNAEVAKDFFMVLPMDTSFAKAPVISE